MTEHARDGRRESRPSWIPAAATMAVVLLFGMIASVPAAAQVPPAHTGTLAVKKVVVNTTGGPVTLPPTFATTTHCSQNAATLPVHTPIAVPGNTTVMQPSQVNTGLNCSVTEVVPPPVTGLAACKGRDATWTAAYSAPVTIVTGQTATLTVTNTLTCNPPTGGTLQIHKSVVNTLGVPTPANFNMLATCSGMNPVPVAVAANGTVTVPPAGQIPEGTVCTITETLPPQVTGVKACPSGTASWVASNPGPLTVHTAQTTGTIITNTLTCDKPTGRTGSLAVKKIVVNNTGGPITLPPIFATTTHCSANAATLPVNTPVGVPGNTTVTQPGQLNAGFVCSVTEVVPPPIRRLEACKGRGATWTVAYSAPVTIVAGQTALLTVTNTLTCDPPTGGTLQIHKSVVNTLGVPTPANFNLLATCSGMNPVPVAVAVNGTVTVPPAGQIPEGTVCTITETLPPQVVGVKACPSGTASWVASNPGPLTVHTAQTTGTIITNTLTCDKPTGKPGALKVVKSVAIPAGVSASIPATFAMAVTCTPLGTSNQTIPVTPGPNGYSITGIAAPSQCTVVELVPPPIPGCSWSTTTTPTQPVAIVPGGMTLVSVRNVLSCAGKPTGSLKVMKSVNNATGGPVTMPATFAMTVSCAPQPLQNPSIVVAPGPVGTTVSGIAAPSHCTVTEAPLPPIAHVEGCKGGSASWTTVISPAQPVSVTANQTTNVTVRNTLTCDKPVGTNCPNPSQSTIACRWTVTVKRSKGPAVYSVVVTPPATTPTPNILPSTSSACVIPGQAMINQVTCWYNYNTNPQWVTITATSSTGTVPSGFHWTGDCLGSNVVCTKQVTLTPLNVVANFP
ncbi:MAG: DUF5979 domain-containing protein [Gemmatimonadaceae bacterium]